MVTLKILKESKDFEIDIARGFFYLSKLFQNRPDLFRFVQTCIANRSYKKIYLRAPLFEDPKFKT